jgi:hypothetical protein
VEWARTGRGALVGEPVCRGLVCSPVRKELVWGSYLDRDGWMECYGPTDA